MCSNCLIQAANSLLRFGLIYSVEHRTPMNSLTFLVPLTSPTVLKGGYRTIHSNINPSPVANLFGFSGGSCNRAFLYSTCGIDWDRLYIA
jgi:hypothetical protein